MDVLFISASLIFICLDILKSYSSCFEFISIYPPNFYILNQDIMKGNSCGGGCFNNPCLVKNPEGHFTVSKLEIFKLD